MAEIGGRRYLSRAETLLTAYILRACCRIRARQVERRCRDREAPRFYRFRKSPTSLLDTLYSYIYTQTLSRIVDEPEPVAAPPHETRLSIARSAR